MVEFAINPLLDLHYGVLLSQNIDQERPGSTLLLLSIIRVLFLVLKCVHK